MRAVPGQGCAVVHEGRAMFPRRMSPSDESSQGLSGAARVGAELRATRERFGWTLDQVSASLRIRAAYLEALEGGRVGDLPALIYATGFVRAYAKLLGLDPDLMARRFRAETGEEKPELDFPAPPAQRGVPAGAVILLGVALAVGAYIGWYRVSGERPAPAPVQAVPERLAALADSAAPRPPGKAEAPAAQESRAAPAQSPARGESVATVSPSSAAAAVPPTAAPISASAQSGTGSEHLVLRARADSWVQVRDRQGQVLLNRVMRAGETWPVPPQPPGQQLLLTTGNAGGTELLVDGVAAPALGGPGVVKRDVPLDPALLRDAKTLPPQPGGAKPTAAKSQPVSQ